MAKVNWKSLHDGGGAATKVPGLVRKLLGADEQKRNAAQFHLRDTLVGDGCWYDSAGPAVELLLKGLKKATEPRLALMLAADVVGANHTRAWLEPHGEPEGHQAEAQEAVSKHQAAIMAHLTGDDPTMRVATTMLLAMSPQIDAASQLVDLTRDDDEVVRASALLALARFDDDAARDAVTAHLDDDVVLVRGAAAVSRLRQDPSFGFSDAADALAGWLAFKKSSTGTPLLWFQTLRSYPWFRGLWYRDNAPRVLSAIARHRGDDGIEALTKLVFALGENSNDGVMETQLAKIALELGGFAPEPGQRPPGIDVIDALNEQQRAMATKLADSWLLPKGEYQLPAAGGTRRRWAGLAPAASLERVVEVEGVKMPHWKAISELGWAAFDLLEPLDRWQAVIEACAKSYPPQRLEPGAPVIDQELERAAQIEGLEEHITVLADALAKRFAAAQRAERPIPQSCAMSSLLFLPLARRGKSLEERWEVLVYVGADPQARELLLKLPAAQRARIVCDNLETSLNPFAAVKQTLAVAEIAASKRLGKLLVEGIEEVERRGGLPPPVLRGIRDKHAELLAAHPKLT